MQLTGLCFYIYIKYIYIAALVHELDGHLMLYVRLSCGYVCSLAKTAFIKGTEKHAALFSKNMFVFSLLDFFPLWNTTNGGSSCEGKQRFDVVLENADIQLYRRL